MSKKVTTECNQADSYKANANIGRRTQAGGGKDLVGAAEDWLWVCEREAVTGEVGRERRDAVKRMHRLPCENLLTCTAFDFIFRF